MDSDTGDLLKQQEQQPLRKKRRLSYSDPEDNEAPSESGSDEHTSLSDNGDDGFQVDWSLEPHSRVSNGTARSPKLQAALPAKSHTFSSLGISAPLQAALKGMSIKLPTEVQAACIPPLLEGKIKIRLHSESLYLLIPLQRQRLYWECENGLRENDGVCITYPPETICRSLRNFCTCLDADKVIFFFFCI
jgi:hypothetical protein